MIEFKLVIKWKNHFFVCYGTAIAPLSVALIQIKYFETKAKAYEDCNWRLVFYRSPNKR